MVIDNGEAPEQRSNEAMACSDANSLGLAARRLFGRKERACGVNASLLIPLKNPYWSPFYPHWRSKNADDSGRMRGFSAESKVKR
ncbi:MAG TPA: hypothetical protein VK797_30045 [Tepidisphaeraceae bacterium]|nr:hypothetical protein [Tepidisphaeraceae bacterium]